MVEFGSEFGLRSGSAVGMLILLFADRRGVPEVPISNKNRGGYDGASRFSVGKPAVERLLRLGYAVRVDDETLRLTAAGRKVATTLNERRGRG